MRRPSAILRAGAGRARVLTHRSRPAPAIRTAGRADWFARRWAWLAARCASISARPPASARPSPCSTRAGGAWPAAPTSSSPSPRPTAARTPPLCLADLPAVARQQVVYRGAEFEEMDLAAVLARRPAVALVDELAHTNVPGSGPHERRWQDVEDLLDAGIDVISTLNIQHLESLNDVVQQITGVPQRETVPDAVVRAADQLELVDMAPGGAAPPDGARQRLPGRAGRRRAGQLLPRRQPHRAARARAAVAGRLGRGGPAALPRPSTASPARGRRRNASSSRSPAGPRATR